MSNMSNEIVNEAFLRVGGSVEACKELEESLDKAGVGDSIERANLYICTANAYRRNKDFDESFAYLNKAYAIIEKIGDANNRLSYFNNLAALHQDAGKLDEAVKCAKQALSIAIENLHSENAIAVSRTNLATMLLRMKRLGEAEEYLMPAIDYYKKCIECDFHYAAALSAAGDLYMARGLLDKASVYFEMALSEILLHIGEGSFYDVVYEHLLKVNELQRKDRNVSGLELCKAFFELFGKPILEDSFSNILEHIAVGLIGEGSECYGFDDEISKDHDFGPGFCIFYDESVNEADIERLNKMYRNLPKSFMGVTRYETPNGMNQVGVISLKKFLLKTTKFDHVPVGDEEWQYTVDENLSLLVNGEVFLDKGNILISIRERIGKEQPLFTALRKMAYQLELMARYGQYSYERAIARDDKAAAYIAKAEFMKAAMRAMHCISGKFAPFSKWLKRSLQEISYWDEAVDIIEELSSSSVGMEDVDRIEQICKIVKKKLVEKGLVHNEEKYLAVSSGELCNFASRYEIANRVIELSRSMLATDENESLLSEYECFRMGLLCNLPTQILEYIYAYYSNEMNLGRNIIANQKKKYLELMEKSAGEIKSEICDENDEEISSYINGIVSYVVQCYEEFAQIDMTLAKKMQEALPAICDQEAVSIENAILGTILNYRNEFIKMIGIYLRDMQMKGINFVTCIAATYKLLKK